MDFYFFKLFSCCPEFFFFFFFFNLQLFIYCCVIFVFLTQLSSQKLLSLSWQTICLIIMKISAASQKKRKKKVSYKRHPLWFSSASTSCLLFQLQSAVCTAQHVEEFPSFDKCCGSKNCCAKKIKKKLMIKQMLAVQ